jgi:son of sevenless
MTFRTFTTADELFDMLVQSYETNPPADLTSSGLEEWRAKWQGPTRKRILMIFLLWLEDHGLLDEEPWIANRITHFLTAKVTPSPMKVTAKLILDSIHRLVLFISF